MTILGQQRYAYYFQYLVAVRWTKTRTWENLGSQRKGLRLNTMGRWNYADLTIFIIITPLWIYILMRIQTKNRFKNQFSGNYGSLVHSNTIAKWGVFTPSWYVGAGMSLSASATPKSISDVHKITLFSIVMGEVINSPFYRLNTYREHEFFVSI